jgi:hypothetical protein
MHGNNGVYTQRIFIAYRARVSIPGGIELHLMQIVALETQFGPTNVSIFT